MPVFEYRIHPSVGIARMGDSPNAYFVGREAPVDRFDPVLRVIPGGDATKVPGAQPFRDKDDKLAKQAARFRIFCFEYPDDYLFFRDAHPTAVWEVTAADYDIEWRVKVANKKAREVVTVSNIVMRPNEPDETAFHTTVAGDFTTVKPFTGKPAGRLNLGSGILDVGGQVLILGSSGMVQGIPGVTTGSRSGMRWTNWEDDAADGYVQATVTPRATSSLADMGQPATEARQAWVVINLPQYGMDVRSSVTLYDLALNHALANSGAGSSWVRPAYYSAPISFHTNVEPVLKAYVSNLYVSPEARLGMSGTGTGHVELTYSFLTPPPNAQASYFHAVLRTPWWTKWHFAEDYWASSPPAPTAYPVSAPGMPRLEYLALPEVAYQWMTAWSSGTTVTGSASVFASALVLDQPWLLDLAHIGTMSGGSFFPGMEVGREVHSYTMWTADWGATAGHVDIRFGGEVGDMTQSLALPWQADFVRCTNKWWPASRPVEVKQAATPFYDWMHDGVGKIGAVSLVAAWARLGFIRLDTASGELWEESRLLGHP